MSATDSLEQLGAEIVARIAAVEKARDKALDHELAAGLRLIEARDKTGASFPDFLRAPRRCLCRRAAEPSRRLSLAGCAEARRQDGGGDLPLRDWRGAAMTDYLSEAGARELAAWLREFWRQRGQRVSVWTERVEFGAKAEQKPFIFHVVRGLVAGLPLPPPRPATIESTAP